jgi:hypothetical protein
MTMRKITLGGALALLVCFSFVPMAFAEVIPTKYSWTKPTTGSEPVRYVVEMRWRLKDADPEDWSIWGEMGDTAELSFILPFETGRCHEVRVRAQDAAGLFGPYSIPSEEYCPPEVEDSGENQDNLGPLPPGKPAK